MMRWRWVPVGALTALVGGLAAFFALDALRSTAEPRGFHGLRQLLLENRALSRQAAWSAEGGSKAQAEQYARVRAGKRALLERLGGMTVAREFEAAVAAARLAMEAEIRLLTLLEERSRLEAEIAETQRIYLDAVSRLRGVPTAVEPRDSSRFMDDPVVRGALTRRAELRRRLDELGPALDAVALEARARHARLDDVAFGAGLVPYRTAPPF